MTIIKKCLVFMIMLFSYSLTSAQSNDPGGAMFLVKPFGDISNCGPISALMLEKYNKPKLVITSLQHKIKQARKLVLGKAGNTSNAWWRMDDIKKYLEKTDVKYKSQKIPKKQSVKQNENYLISLLNQGNVLLINVNMNDLPRGSNIDKAYMTFPLLGKPWGHYLVVVGYKKINGKIFFDIHDSYSVKGRNRLFNGFNIVNAIKHYNSEVLYVKRGYKLDDLWVSLLH